MTKNRSHIVALIFATSALCITAALAQELGPGPFDLEWHSIDGGGGTSNGGGAGGFVLAGTIGQPDASAVAMSGGGGFEVRGGFWAAAGPAPRPICRADLAPSGGDGLVGVPDLLAIINAWGPCDDPPALCPADIAPLPRGDNTVGVPDLLFIINNWGVCP